MKKKIVVIAGPNGAGKTTTAASLVIDLLWIEEFLNADEIARGLAPLNPESVSLAASKLMIKRFRELLEAKKNFAFETTAAGTNYVKYLHEARQNGYEITLVYLWLSDPQLAVERVAKRVAQGGHSIAEAIVRRRYYLGLKNILNYYLHLADKGIFLDNSDGGNKIILEKEEGKLRIANQQIWQKMQELTDERN